MGDGLRYAAKNRKAAEMVEAAGTGVCGLC